MLIPVGGTGHKVLAKNDAIAYVVSNSICIGALSNLPTAHEVKNVGRIVAIIDVKRHK